MSDFTPIPGVTYRVTHFGRQRFATFTPQAPEDFAPWVDLDGDWFQLEGDDKILGVAYNPHPPTRTEWAWKYEINPTILVTGEDEAAARRQSAQESGRVLRRQVTEWQEVDQ